MNPIINTVINFIIASLFIILFLGVAFGIKKNSYINENEDDDQKAKKHWDNEYFLKHGCPFCGSDAFEEGPCGGCSVNIRCSKCGARFNSMGHFGVDLLEGPTNYYKV